MESCIPSEPACWSPPAWLERTLVADARFARGYNALGDSRRALLKALIARHYALAPPAPCSQTLTTQRFDLFTQRVETKPAPLVLLLTDESLDSPALFLAALLPALCARVPQVLVCRLGGKSALPDSLLVSCELAGQERVAAVGPVQLQRLLADCAAGNAAGLVLHPDTDVFHRLLGQKTLRRTLAHSALRFVPLRLPQAMGLWRDHGSQFPPEDVALLYGSQSFETAGAQPTEPLAGKQKRSRQEDPAWKAFNATPRHLLLAPDERSAQGRAEVVVSESCLGQWIWPELRPGLFTVQRRLFAATP